MITIGLCQTVIENNCPQTEDDEAVRAARYRAFAESAVRKPRPRWAKSTQKSDDMSLNEEEDEVSYGERHMNEKRGGINHDDGTRSYNAPGSIDSTTPSPNQNIPESSSAVSNLAQTATDHLKPMDEQVFKDATVWELTVQQVFYECTCNKNI